MAALLCLAGLALAIPVIAVPAHAETLGGWTSTNAPPSDSGPLYSCVAYSGYEYCVGSEASAAANAIFAPVYSSGLGAWSTTTAYPTSYGNGGIEQLSCAASSGYIYCVGGYTQGSGKTPLAAVYYAPLSSSGIGTWVQTTSYPMAVADESCAISGSYIYCVGGLGTGDTPFDNVYYAPISSSGVGAWTGATAYPFGVFESSCTVVANYIYCIGGDTSTTSVNLTPTSAVYYAALSSSGVGTWTSTTGYPVAVSYASCSASSQSYIYCLGGFSSSSWTSGAYYASASSSGVGVWTSTTSYPTSSYMIECVISGSYIYCITNTSLVPAAAYAQISPAPDTSALTVNSEDTSGNPLPGFYTLLYQSGSVVGTGFTPASFTLNNGQSYVVQVDDYGNCHFQYWADTGSTAASRTIAITANDAITAVYACSGSDSSVTVNSIDQDGQAIFGYYTVLFASGGSQIATGFTTKTFATTSGDAYSVQVDGYGSCSFSQWSDGVTSNPRTFTATSGATYLTAVYTCASTGTSTISVSTVGSGGGSLSGYYVSLWQGGVQLQSCFSACSFTVNNGQTYQVIAASYGSETFNHWQNDGATGPETVNVPSTSTTISLTAVYSP